MSLCQAGDEIASGVGARSSQIDSMTASFSWRVMSLRGRLIDMSKVYLGVERIETTLAKGRSSLRTDQLSKAREESLLQLRDTVDDAESDVVAELDLNHFGGKVFADLIHVVHGEADLTAAALDEVIEQQRGEVAHFFIVGMLAEVQYLRHDGFNVSLW